MILLGLGIGRTVSRYPAWQDQFTLFQQTTIDAPLSYGAYYGHADLLAQMGRGQEAETEYRVATQLFPEMESVVAPQHDGRSVGHPTGVERRYHLADDMVAVADRRQIAPEYR